MEEHLSRHPDAGGPDHGRPAATGRVAAWPTEAARHGRTQHARTVGGTGWGGVGHPLVPAPEPAGHRGIDPGRGGVVAHATSGGPAPTGVRRAYPPGSIRDQAVAGSSDRPGEVRHDGTAALNLTQVGATGASIPLPHLPSSFAPRVRIGPVGTGKRCADADPRSGRGTADAVRGRDRQLQHRNAEAEAVRYVNVVNGVRLVAYVLSGAGDQKELLSWPPASR